jgi:hypothetical protein
VAGKEVVRQLAAVGGEKAFVFWAPQGLMGGDAQ